MSTRPYGNGGMFRRTTLEKARSLESILQIREQWELRWVEHRRRSSKMAVAATDVQIVGQRDTVSTGHLIHFVLAVAVEGCPLNRRLRPSETSIFLGCGFDRRPVKEHFFAKMAYSTASTCS